MRRYTYIEVSQDGPVVTLYKHLTLHKSEQLIHLHHSHTHSSSEHLHVIVVIVPWCDQRSNKLPLDLARTDLGRTDLGSCFYQSYTKCKTIQIYVQVKVSACY